MSGRPNRGFFNPSHHIADRHPGEARQASPGHRGAKPDEARNYVAEARKSLPPDWRNRIYLALDFETTGLDPRRERVVEIGALRFRIAAQDRDAGPLFEAVAESTPDEEKLREEGCLSVLVNPGIPIPSITTAIHGIGDDDVKDAKTFAEIAPALATLAKDAIIVAHNAPFDLSFLGAELSRAELPASENESIDSRIIARAAYPGLPSYRLVDLTRTFGIDAGRSHRALDDARSCAVLFLHAAFRFDALAMGQR